jgi:hypothetical protein
MHAPWTMAIKPNPPVPTITTFSSGFRLAFFTAPYDVSPALYDEIKDSLPSFLKLHKIVKEQGTG